MSHCSDAPSFPDDGDGVIAREVEHCNRRSSNCCSLCYKGEKTMDELNSPSRHPPSINKLFLWSNLLIITVIPMSPSTGEAQVTTNMTSSGLNTQVTQVSIESTITGGTRPGGGPHLFHRFGNFTAGTRALANSLNNTGPAPSNMRDDGARTLIFIKHPISPNGAGKLESAAARVTQPVGSPTMPPDGVMQKNQSFPLRR